MPAPEIDDNTAFSLAVVQHEKIEPSMGVIDPQTGERYWRMRKPGLGEKIVTHSSAAKQTKREIIILNIMAIPVLVLSILIFCMIIIGLIYGTIVVFVWVVIPTTCIVLGDFAKIIRGSSLFLFFLRRREYRFKEIKRYGRKNRFFRTAPYLSIDEHFIRAMEHLEAAQRMDIQAQELSQASALPNRQPVQPPPRDRSIHDQEYL